MSDWEILVLGVEAVLGASPILFGYFVADYITRDTQTNSQEKEDHGDEHNNNSTEIQTEPFLS